MIAPDFAAHRAALLKRLADDEAVLLFGGPPQTRSRDTEYVYRPNSDLYWLTGWEDPEVAMLLRPGERPLTLFVQAKDPEREIWEGYRPGPDGAREDYGADAAFRFDQLGEELPRLLQGIRVLHYPLAADADLDALVMGAIHKAARAARTNGLPVPQTFHSPSVLLHELRLIKLPDELEVMRQAASVSAHAHRRLMAMTRPGLHEYELEADLLASFRRHGGTGPGYNPIVAGGANATVLHYIKNRDPLRDGELLLVDAGGEHCYYTADITRTWPINGRFTEPQREVYLHVLRAQEAAIAAVKVGAPWSAIHDAAVRVLTEAMVQLGLLQGEVDTLIEDKAFRRYYMHGTGHWLGLDVHDVGAYALDGASRPLQPGMVLTVEPGLYIPKDDLDAPAHLRGIGVRIEDNVLVTAEGPEILTHEVPRDPDAIEALVGSAS